MLNLTSPNRFASEKSKIGMTEKNYVAQYDAIAEMDDGSISSIITAKFYCGDTGVVRCSVRLSLDDIYNHGIGKAGGCGYDKMATSFFSALHDMGETIRYSGIDVRQSIEDIGKSLEGTHGVKKLLVVNHGFAD